MSTPTQHKALAFIQEFYGQHNYGPTLEEIGAAIGIHSKGTVHRHVTALVKQGHLTRTSRSWRSMRLTGTAGKAIPLLGCIAAGQPIEAIPGQDEINLADFFVGPGRFALKVQGDSMIEIGILDQDIVIIQQQNTANEGDIVVALIDGEEATLKRLQQCNNGDILLVPENSTMKAMRYKTERVRIQGVLIGQLRSYK